MPARDAKRPPLLVTVVSKNASTLVGLEAYLRGVGAVTTSTADLERLVDVTPRTAAAVIVFPDEYSQDLAIQALAALERARPDVLAVVVTNEPGRFASPDAEEDPAASPLVMPKPAWAWTIMDAVRARLAARPQPAPLDRGSGARRPGRDE